MKRRVLKALRWTLLFVGALAVTQAALHVVRLVWEPTIGLWYSTFTLPASVAFGLALGRPIFFFGLAWDAHVDGDQ